MVVRMKLPTAWPIGHSLRRAIRKFPLWAKNRSIPVIISYPKSGRTWLRYMLDLAGVEAAYTHGDAEVYPPRKFDALSIHRSLLRRRVLFLLRDPRDTLVSHWFHETKRAGRFEGDLSAFLRHPCHGLAKIVCFNQMWIAAEARFPAFELLRYEDLHWDCRKHLAHAVHFLTGMEPDTAKIDRIADAGRFDVMHALEASGAGAALYGSILAPGDATDRDSFKTRRGIIGGWRDYFSPDDIAYADAVFHHYGYDPSDENRAGRR